MKNLHRALTKQLRGVEVLGHVVRGVKVTNQKQPTSRTAPLGADQRNDVAKVLDELGEAEAAKELGVSRLALVRALAGMPVRLSIATCIATNVARLGLK